jgi:hypothetical protein
MRLIPRLSNSGVAVRGRSSVARPAARAATSPASTAASRPASSAAAGGFLAALVGWAALFGLLVVMPIAMLANGAEPGVVGMWMVMVAASMAISWWSERREHRRWLRQHGKPPKQPTSPCAEEFQRRWGTTEHCAEAEKTAPETAWVRLAKWAAGWSAGKAEAAPVSPAEPVPLFIVNEPLPGSDPQVLEARGRACVIEVLQDEYERAKAAGLNREDTIEHLARVIGGAKPAARGSKASVQPGGDGGGQWDGRGPAIEARVERGRLPRRGG